MSEKIMADERAKHVVGGAGNEIGIVDDVDDGTAYVDPNPDIAGELKPQLGWGADEQSNYPLRNDVIDTITDEEIRCVWAPSNRINTQATCSREPRIHRGLSGILAERVGP